MNSNTASKILSLSINTLQLWPERLLPFCRAKKTPDNAVGHPQGVILIMVFEPYPQFCQFVYKPISAFDFSGVAVESPCFSPAPYNRFVDIFKLRLISGNFGLQSFSLFLPFIIWVQIMPLLDVVSLSAGNCCIYDMSLLIPFSLRRVCTYYPPSDLMKQKPLQAYRIDTACRGYGFAKGY